MSGSSSGSRGGTSVGMLPPAAQGAGGERAAEQRGGAGGPKIRALELRKAPSISESLDWVRSLVILNADRLDPALVEATLTLVVKYERDLERVKSSLDKVLAES